MVGIDRGLRECLQLKQVKRSKLVVGYGIHS
jgi:hypothetical protein